MLPIRKTVTCYSCGKRVEFTSCSDRQDAPEDAPCQVLSGWLTVSHWKGVRFIDRYDFCSFTCLQRWVEAQVPKIPGTFLKAFPDK